MAKQFHLTIASVGENLFDGEAYSVTLPGVEGVLTVLADHEALVTPLAVGSARIHPEQGGAYQDIPLPTQGILEVSSNQATVIL